MNIALIGFGKIGRSIARLASPEHKLSLIVDSSTPDTTPEGAIFLKDITEADIKLLNSIDVFFEFTTPSSAQKNILDLLKVKKNAKIICGTTGWDIDSVKDTVEKNGASLLVSSNFSVGINAIRPCLKELSASLSKKGFRVAMTDLHHKDKKDAPSGTAKALVQIIESTGIKCPVQSFREGDYVGTHTIRFESDFEIVEIKHEAKNRDVFCIGAIHSAEWLNSQNSSGKIFKS